MLHYPLLFIFAYAVIVGAAFAWIDSDGNGPHTPV